MLGVYDYTVVLTYVSLMVSIGGMMFVVAFLFGTEKQMRRMR